MNIQFEVIKGFQLGIDYVEDIPIPEYDSKADLLRISLGFFFMHIFLFR